MCLWHYRFLFSLLCFCSEASVLSECATPGVIEQNTSFSSPDFPKISKHHLFKDGSLEEDTRLREVVEKRQLTTNNGRESGAFLPRECQGSEHVQEEYTFCRQRE